MVACELKVANCTEAEIVFDFLEMFLNSIGKLYSTFLFFFQLAGIHIPQLGLELDKIYQIMRSLWKLSPRKQSNKTKEVLVSDTVKNLAS